MNDGNWPRPWPIEQLIARLSVEKTLTTIIRPRQHTAGHDVREHFFEQEVAESCEDHFGRSTVSRVRQIGKVLRLRERPFPARSQPDITEVGDEGMGEPDRR